MKETYFIQKEGVYPQGIYGIFFDKNEAINMCNDLASCDCDNYHDWVVYKNVPGTFAHEEIYKTRK